MKLITAHRILIVAGIVFFLFYAARQLWAFLGAGGPGALVQSGAAAAVAVGFIVYYRTLSRRWGRPGSP
ncbi:MAG: hypothetical protein ACREJG_03755 [Candidatus Rokuibacteriota bacterium]